MIALNGSLSEDKAFTSKPIEHCSTEMQVVNLLLKVLQRISEASDRLRLPPGAVRHRAGLDITKVLRRSKCKPTTGN
jgi:hypothetical protein